MKQVCQSYRTGEVQTIEVPSPAAAEGGVLVRTRASLISPGTEKALVDESRASLLRRAARKPQVIKSLVGQALTQGLSAARDRVESKLDSWVPLGYSSSGEVVAVGRNVHDLAPPSRVACAGTGYAVHGELAWAPRNLCTPLPDTVSFEQGAFVALGAIAMQGVRQARVHLGETVGVIGLGLVGQLTVGLLRAAGCRVLATDLLASRRRLAEGAGAGAVGAERFAQAARQATDGHGADAVIVAASGSSDSIVRSAAEACRRKGRVVIVGAVPMNLPRGPFYDKELELALSMSYGPGRYDPNYEERGIDYPYSLARWTEGRNMSAFIQLLAEGRLDVDRLITARYDIEHAERAYADLENPAADSIATIFRYPRPDAQVLAETRVEPPHRPAASAPLRVGVIGAGAFATSTLLPATRSCRSIRMVAVATATGRSATTTAERFSMDYCTCEPRELLADSSIDAVLILTRHHLHAAQVVEALEAGKHVFVEKPLALTIEELADIRSAMDRAADRLVLTGHNRRFSPAAEALRAHFAERCGPMTVCYRVNAGPLPDDHWVCSERNGGRWLGEGSHFVDFAACLVGQAPSSVLAARTGSKGHSWTVTLRFPDGSTASILYCDTGPASLPKERCEAFADGKAAVLDDFRSLRLWGPHQTRTIRLGGEKGHRAEMEAFASMLLGQSPPPISAADQLAIAEATILCVHSHRLGRWLAVGRPVEE